MLCFDCKNIYVCRIYKYIYMYWNIETNIFILNIVQHILAQLPSGSSVLRFSSGREYVPTWKTKLLAVRSATYQQLSAYAEPISARTPRENCGTHDAPGLTRTSPGSCRLIFTILIASNDYTLATCCTSLTRSYEPNIFRSPGLWQF